MATRFFNPRPPDSWSRGQRRRGPRKPFDWPSIARREGWVDDPPRARRSDTEVASELRCARSLVSRMRNRFGAPAFEVDSAPPALDELPINPPLRLAELEEVAGSRARARRWLRVYVGKGLLVAVGTSRSRRWLLSTAVVPGHEE